MKTQLEAIRKIDPIAAEYIDNQLYFISKIDAEATKYILDVVIPRYSRNLFFMTNTIQKGAELLDFFMWKSSPQGREYWLNIYRGLNVTNSSN